VRSYFESKRNREGKTRELVAHIADFTVIRTDTPAEALILENELIKRYHPKYNVMLRDDKSYPFIRITNEPFPRIISTRQIVRDGSRYFGPYPNVQAVRTVIRLLKRLFLFPYAPWAKDLPQPVYRQIVDRMIAFLEGGGEGVVSEMRAAMEMASDDLKFEQAARIRDDIAAIEYVLARQKIVSHRSETFDVLAVAQGDSGNAGVQVATIRKGKMVGSDYFALDEVQANGSAQALLTAFVIQFYETAVFVPHELLVQYTLKDSDMVLAWLAERRGGPVKLWQPKRGERRRLVDMVAKSARENLAQRRICWQNHEQTTAPEDLSEMDAVSNAIDRETKPVGLDVEQEVGNIAVLDDVGLPFEPQLARLAGLRQATGFDQIVIAHDFGSNEATLDVRVDHPGRLHGGRTGSDRPGTAFVRSDGEERDQP
jgi:excinuclease ABC subunit C